jgi:hypothetical protein
MLLLLFRGSGAPPVAGEIGSVSAVMRSSGILGRVSSSSASTGTLAANTRVSQRSSVASQSERSSSVITRTEV